MTVNSRAESSDAEGVANLVLDIARLTEPLVDAAMVASELDTSAFSTESAGEAR